MTCDGKDMNARRGGYRPKKIERISCDAQGMIGPILETKELNQGNILRMGRRKSKEEFGSLFRSIVPEEPENA